MHYFDNLTYVVGFWGLLAPRPTGTPSLDPTGGLFVSGPPNLPTPEKNSGVPMP